MPQSALKTFYAVLEPLKSGVTWTVVRLPVDVFAGWAQLRGNRVRGELAGVPFRTTLIADADAGRHFLLVNKKMQAAAKIVLGSKVKVRIEPDLEERVAVVPPELAKALKGDRRLRPWFDRLPPGMRKWMGDQATQPKSAQARRNRSEQIAEWLLQVIEGETDTPPILKAAFQRQSLARVGWEAMTRLQRGHLLGIFHLQSTEARARRAAAAVDDALRVAQKKRPAIASHDESIFPE